MQVQDLISSILHISYVFYFILKAICNLLAEDFQMRWRERLEGKAERTQHCCWATEASSSR